MIKTILIIAFLVLSVVLTIIILMQEGKDSGLSGALTYFNTDLKIIFEKLFRIKIQNLTKLNIYTNIFISDKFQYFYWAKNKGRSKDAVIKKVTVFLAVLYFVLAILLRSKWI